MSDDPVLALAPLVPVDGVLEPVYDAVLVDVGPNRLATLRRLRIGLWPDLGLLEVKRRMDKLPVILREDIDLSDAQDIKREFSRFGARVEIVPGSS